MNKAFVIISIFVFFSFKMAAQPVTQKGLAPDQKTITLPAEKVIDKIRGGMLGQILGNLNGLVYENAFLEEPGNVKNYVPSLPEGARTDDDTDFEWVYICEMQKYRNPYLSNDSIYNLWRTRINQRIWCSNRWARYLMDLGIKPPYTGYIVLNPWAEFNISGQFLCEMFGLLAPAMPQTAAKIGLNYTRVAIDNEPAQTTQLFTAMISTAFIESDINKIIDAGISAIDEKSVVASIVKDLRTWHKQYPDDWRKTRLLLKEKYSREGQKVRDRNGYDLNTGSIIGALLYGEGDYAETMKYTFNFGWDADNTAATAGTIIGVIKGYRWFLSQDWQIVDRYHNTTRDNMPMDETITSFSDRLIELFEMINENNGGTKELINNVVSYKIRQENPKPVLMLSSVDEQKQQLIQQLTQTITENIKAGNRQQKASAAYLAICLDMNTSLSKQYPKQWKDACYELSGYWKVMNNLFDPYPDHNFKSLTTMREKFMAAGFKKPAKGYSDDELYNDSVVWKDPKNLYLNK